MAAFPPGYSGRVYTCFLTSFVNALNKSVQYISGAFVLVFDACVLVFDTFETTFKIRYTIYIMLEDSECTNSEKIK